VHVAPNKTRRKHPVRFLLLTAGTRGDVEPFVALARAAAARGHQVRLGVPDNSGVDTEGIDAVSLGMDFAQLISDQGVSPTAAARTFRTVLRPAVGRLLAAAVDHITAFAPDVVVYHPKVLSAPLAAGRLGVPAAVVETVPALTPTREFPAPYITTANLAPLNRATYLAAPLANLMFSRELDAALQSLPVGKKPGKEERNSLMPVSPALLPRPRDWPPTVHLTGHWTWKDGTAALDAELEDFMNSGRFIYAGFGSMKDGDAAARGNIIVDAARRCGLNVLAVTGWGGIDLPGATRDGVLVRGSVAHGLVLPRAAAAIHHGGAGTVHAVARAGVPSVVVPFIGDQPFWGQVLHRQGLAPGPIQHRRLTVDRLIQALGRTEICWDAATRTGEQMRNEDGTGAALDVLEHLAR
jgi:sterol 3beta-glucosyltransferase